MTPVLPAMAAGPLAVAAGLLLFRSVSATFILFHGAVCLGIPLMGILTGRASPGDYGLRRDPGGVKRSLIAGSAAFLAVLLFFALLRDRIWNMEEITAVLGEWGAGSMNPIVFGAMMVLGNAFLEELFWRGYALSRLVRVTSRRRAVLISAAFYSSYHGLTTGMLFSIPFAIISVAAVFATGVYWGRKSLETGSLLFPVVTHLCVDLAIIAAYFIFLSG